MAKTKTETKAIKIADVSDPDIFHITVTKEIRMFFETFKGTDLFHIRHFYREDENSEWQFGKGIAIKKEMLPEIIPQIVKASGIK